MLLLGGLSVMFAAGLPWRYVGGATILALGAMPLLWMTLHDYQKSRVMTFLNPEADVLGAGYQIIQSKIALGSGGLFGKGFLMGSQSQLDYLPEKQTDFVFTMIGEEFGLVGNLFILGLYLALSLSILRISYLVRESVFSAYLYGHKHDVVFLCICECGDGQRHVASGGCAIAADFIWRHINANSFHWFGHCDQYLDP